MNNSDVRLSNYLFNIDDCLSSVLEIAHDKAREIIRENDIQDIYDAHEEIDNLTTYDSDNSALVTATWYYGSGELARACTSMTIEVTSIGDLDEIYRDLAWKIWEIIFEEEIRKYLYGDWNE